MGSRVGTFLLRIEKCQDLNMEGVLAHNYDFGFISVGGGELGTFWQASRMGTVASVCGDLEPEVNQQHDRHRHNPSLPALLSSTSLVVP